MRLQTESLATIHYKSSLTYLYKQPTRVIIQYYPSLVIRGSLTQSLSHNTWQGLHQVLYGLGNT